LTAPGISRNTLVSSVPPEHAVAPAWQLGSWLHDNGHREGEQA
jgi:hypothetical protein